jgi:hypothetical protein
MHHVREMEELRDKFVGGNRSGSWGLDDGSVMGVAEELTAQNPANGECTYKTFRVFGGGPLEITQSFRLRDDGRMLVYDFRVRGLHHQESHRMEFYQRPSPQ